MARDVKARESGAGGTAAEITAMMGDPNWAMVAVDHLPWRETVAAELEAIGVDAFTTPADPGAVLEALTREELALPALLVFRAARPTEDDLLRLHRLHRMGVGVIVTADHRTAPELRRADRAGLVSRAWRYGSVAVVSQYDLHGLVRVARELLRNVELYGPAASWRVSRLPAA